MSTGSDHNSGHRRLRSRITSPLLGVAAAAVLLSQPAVLHAQDELRDDQPRITIRFLDSATVNPVMPARREPGGQSLADLDISPDLLDAVTRLGDPEFNVRERASQWIISNRWDTGEAYAILQSAELLPEQRERLLAAVYDRLINMPRGALGVRQRFIRPPGEVFGYYEIDELLPDLPAIRVLHLRDRITHYDGHRPVQQDSLMNYVQQRQPGDEVEFIVERIVRDERGNAQRDANDDFMYETLTVKVALGSADKLVDERGLPQASPVQNSRRSEAAKLVHLWSIGSQPIRFRTRNQFETGPDRQRLIEMADEHREIATLKRQLELIERGRLRYDDQLEAWDRKLRELRLLRRDPTVTEAEGIFLDILIDRFLELTQPDQAQRGG